MPRIYNAASNKRTKYHKTQIIRDLHFVSASESKLYIPLKTIRLRRQERSKEQGKTKRTYGVRLIFIYTLDTIPNGRTEDRADEKSFKP